MLLHPSIPACMVQGSASASSALANCPITPPSCSGDPIPCAEVQQAYVDECANLATLATTTLNDYDPAPDNPGVNPTQIIQDGTSNTGWVDTISGATGFVSGSSCPKFGGSIVVTDQLTINMDSTDFCSLWALIHIMVVSGALLASGKIVLGT